MSSRKTHQIRWERLLAKYINLKRSPCRHYITCSRTADCDHNRIGNRINSIESKSTETENGPCEFTPLGHSRTQSKTSISCDCVDSPYYRPSAHMLVTRWPPISACRKHTSTGRRRYDISEMRLLILTTSYIN